MQANLVEHSMNADGVFSPSVKKVSMEYGVEIYEEMQGRIRFSVEDGEVFFGDHPKYGRIYLLRPAFGDTLILPFASL